jgi:hypothetical protein
MNLDETGELQSSVYDFDKPERALWCAALELLLDDARHYWKGTKGRHNSDSRVLEHAFDDVVSIGATIRNLCELAGYDAEWVSAKWIKSLG